MAKVIIQLSGGAVQDVIMDEPVEVYVLDYDCESEVLPGIKSDFVDGEECINAFYSDVISPAKVEHIISQLR